MKILCITEPATHPPFDTTVELYRELANDSEIELAHTSPAEISENDSIRVFRVERALEYDEFLELGSGSSMTSTLSSFDVIFCRTDKPFHPGYLETLSRHESHAQFVNSPAGLIEVGRRDFLPTIASRLLPEFIVSREMSEIRTFIENRGEAVAKQNGSYGGKGIFRVRAANSEFSTENAFEGTRYHPTLELLIKEILSRNAEPYTWTRFLSRVSEGDKRILVVAGEIYGGYLRRARNGGWVNNITAGGEALPAEVTKKERQTIDSTSPAYASRGVFTLGYDFLTDDDGSWILSEINAGNIGGYGRLEQVSGSPVYPRLIRWLKGRARR